MAKFKVIKEDKFGSEIEGEYDNREMAEARLIDVIANTISNFNDYESNDIDDIIEKGFERYGMGVIYIEEDGIKPSQISK